jgi:hypothetical protein
MTKREARQMGRAVGREVITHGDFTAEEKEDQDSLSTAFWAIVENRSQYAGDPTEALHTDNLWDGYEDGLSIALSTYLRKHFKRQKGD